LKTKPTQHSVKELRSLGIQPDIIICRSEKNIPINERKKISLFCNVDYKNVIETVDVRTIYEAPISFYKEKFDERVLSHFNVKSKKLPNLRRWRNITSNVLEARKHVNIGIIGKYVNLKDAYKSLDEALVHGGISNNLKIKLTRIDSEHLKIKDLNLLLKNVSGILIPGGFGKRGSEGKIAAIKYARLNNIPFFGICFGMQMAVIEAARNLLNIKNASTSEFGNNCTPVVGLLEEWQKGKKIFKGSEKDLGGTMRLGLYDAILKKNSLISKIYFCQRIKERHRHRYEVNFNIKMNLKKKD
jgi:CTP synthase (UTP-ammonia lyase)